MHGQTHIKLLVYKFWCVKTIVIKSGGVWCLNSLIIRLFCGVYKAVHPKLEEALHLL